MIAEFKLTIISAGSLESLAEALAPLGGWVVIHLTEGRSFWEAGEDMVLSQPMGRLEAYLEAEWVPAALDRVHDWWQGEDKATTLVEVRRAFAQVIDRNTD